MFSKETHKFISLFGLCALAFGMMVGTVPTSVPLFILLGNWLLEMDFKRKWQTLRSHKLFWILASIFLIHVLGLLYTTDLKSGWDDVRTKIPVVLLPLILFSNPPLLRKEIYWVLGFFLAGAFANTLWSIVYSYALHPDEIIRNTSRFMSHIRLGLYLNMAVFTCTYFIYKIKTPASKILLSLLALYFLISFFALGLISGLFYFIILLFLALAVLIFRQKLRIKLCALLLMIVSIFIVTGYLMDMKNGQLKVKEGGNNIPMDSSAAGNPYMHLDLQGPKENGNYVLINIQEPELQKEWNRQFPNDSFNVKIGYNINRYEILLRYLASKGLNKDASAIRQLTDEDKAAVQIGITNYLYSDWGFLDKRVYELINEYDDLINNRHVDGQSLTMRWYFWKAAFYTIKANPFFGVGTGDVQQAMNEAYEVTNSPLSAEWRKRPHNQFITVTVALGVIGLLVFLLGLFYPTLKYRKFLPVMYWPFFILLLLSFIGEDTLETQAGLTFYAFFNSLFLVGLVSKSHPEKTQQKA